MTADDGPPLSNWKRFFIYPLIHIGGVLLILNTVNTYEFGLIFQGCKQYGMTTTCTAYGHYNHIIESVGSLQVVNLLARFMILIGFGLDFLSLLYIAFLYRQLKARYRKPPA